MRHLPIYIDPESVILKRNVHTISKQLVKMQVPRL